MEQGFSGEATQVTTAPAPTLALDKLKRKAKKLEHRLQKVQLREMANQNTIYQMDRLLKEHSEKYRDMKSKLQMKVQERNVTISELRQQVTILQSKQ